MEDGAAISLTLAMKLRTLILIALLAASCPQFSRADDVRRLPFAAPRTEFKFIKATAELFPFDSYIDKNERVVSFKPYGDFRFCRMDLNQDGRDEWVVELKRDATEGPLRIWFFVERKKKLVKLLWTFSHVTVIPKEDTFPVIEDWYKSAEYSSRQRWEFDENGDQYRRVYIDYFHHNILKETVTSKEQPSLQE